MRNKNKSEEARPICWIIEWNTWETNEKSYTTVCRSPLSVLLKTSSLRQCSIHTPFHISVWWEKKENKIGIHKKNTKHIVMKNVRILFIFSSCYYTSAIVLKERKNTRHRIILTQIHNILLYFYLSFKYIIWQV